MPTQFDQQRFIEEFSRNFQRLMGRSPTEQEIERALTMAQQSQRGITPTPSRSLVSTFTTEAEQLRQILGVQPPTTVPQEVKPESVLKDIETLREQTRKYLETERERAIQTARERLEAQKPEIQQMIATLHNVGGFSEEWFRRLVDWLDKSNRILEDIKVSYDQAIALGDIETARSLIQAKTQIYNNLLQERNLYVQTMSQLLNTVGQLRTLTLQEEAAKQQLFAQRLQLLSGSMETLKQIFSSRLGKIKAETDLRGDERVFLRALANNLAQILGTNPEIVYRQFIRFLSQKPKVAQVQTLAGSEGTLFITVDEAGNINYWIESGFRKTSTTKSPLAPIEGLGLPPY